MVKQNIAMNQVKKNVLEKPVLSKLAWDCLKHYSLNTSLEEVDAQLLEARWWRSLVETLVLIGITESVEQNIPSPGCHLRG